MIQCLNSATLYGISINLSFDQLWNADGRFDKDYTVYTLAVDSAHYDYYAFPATAF